MKKLVLLLLGVVLSVTGCSFDSLGLKPWPADEDGHVSTKEDMKVKTEDFGQKDKKVRQDKKPPTPDVFSKKDKKVKDQKTKLPDIAPKPDQSKDTFQPKPDKKIIADKASIPDISPDLQCSEVQGITAGVPCNKQGTCSASDVDCDGLRGATGSTDQQDPWPPKCNLIHFMDGFVDKAVANWVKTKGVTNWKCGKALLGVDASLLSKKVFNPSLLIEMKFVITKISNAANWSVGIKTPAGKGSGQYRLCELWTNASYQSKPGMRLIAHQDAKKGAGTWDGSRDLGAVLNKPFQIQIFSTGKNHSCRILKADGNKLEMQKLVLPEQLNYYAKYGTSSSYPPCGYNYYCYLGGVCTSSYKHICHVNLSLDIKMNAPIELFTSGCAATVDYVRVFKQ